jgi:hypothetical protein
MDSYEDATLLIQWDETNQWILITRKEGIYVEGPDFIAGMEGLLKIVEAHRAQKILGDYSNMRVINREDQGYFIQDWAPRAYDAGLRYFAGVLPRGYAAQMSFKAVTDGLTWQGIKIALFEEVDEAQTWLKSN